MFKPINGDHAIAEVAFIFEFERDFPDSSLKRLFEAHKSFRRELPKAERLDVFQFGFGSAPMPPKPMPVTFSAFKRDGNIDWRLMAGDNNLVVNCLTYTNWNDVSLRSLSILKESSKYLVENSNGVKSVALQYINAFKWAGKSVDYDVGLLLREGSPYIPASLFENVRVPLWHLNQGFFTESDLGPGGRLLQRMNVESNQEGGNFIARIDIVLKLDLSRNLRKPGELFFDDAGMVPTVMDSLHALDKKILRAYITEAMVNRIGLDGGSTSVASA